MPPQLPAGRRKSRRDLGRKGVAALRRRIIQAAHAGLIRTYKNHPFSDDSITALRKEYLHFFGKGDESPSRLSDDALDLHIEVALAVAGLTDKDWDALQEISRETLTQYLKELGIRSKGRAQRPG